MSRAAPSLLLAIGTIALMCCGSQPSPPPGGAGAPATAVAQPSAANIRPTRAHATFDRGDFLAAMNRLHQFYAAPDGLKRPDGLSIGGSPDFLGIAAWVFDVHLACRSAGQSPDDARTEVVARITQSEEWRVKHSGESPRDPTAAPRRCKSIAASSSRRCSGWMCSIARRRDCNGPEGCPSTARRIFSASPPGRSWGASAVLAGHDHTYERIMRDGLPYFVNGAGGFELYALGTPVAGSAVRFNADFGAMLVEADRHGAVFQFVTRAGVVADTLSVAPRAPQ